MKRSPVLLILILLAGCNSWERNAFNTLAASNAVLKNAQDQYQAAAIPQTKCAYTLINDGKAAQTAAVNGLLTYDNAKKASGNVAVEEAAVTSELAALAPLVVQMQALIANPASQCGGKQ